MSDSKRLNWQAARERGERALLEIESGGHSPERLEALRRARTEFLSRPLETQAADEGEAILVFRLGAELYGATLARLTEVLERPPIAAVPGTRPEIAGLIQVRGEIRVVWNLAMLLGTSAESGRLATVLLMRNTAGAEWGLLVEEVMDIRRVREADRLPPPESARHASWTTADLVTVLNIETLLAGFTGEGTRT